MCSSSYLSWCGDRPFIGENRFLCLILMFTAEDFALMPLVCGQKPLTARVCRREEPQPSSWCHSQLPNRFTFDLVPLNSKSFCVWCKKEYWQFACNYCPLKKQTGPSRSCPSPRKEASGAEDEGHKTKPSRKKRNSFQEKRGSGSSLDLHTPWWWCERCCWWRTDRHSCSLGDKSPWEQKQREDIITEPPGGFEERQRRAQKGKKLQMFQNWALPGGFLQ